MDTKLLNGDFETDEQGYLRTISGNEEILQRCLIRLQVNKGSFLLDRDFGSELKTLLEKKPADIQESAYRLTAQALAPIQQVTVERVDCSYTGDKTLKLAVYLQLDKQTRTIEMQI